MLTGRSCMLLSLTPTVLHVGCTSVEFGQNAALTSMPPSHRCPQCGYDPAYHPELEEVGCVAERRVALASIRLDELELRVLVVELGRQLLPVGAQLLRQRRALLARHQVFRRLVLHKTSVIASLTPSMSDEGAVSCSLTSRVGD